MFSPVRRGSDYVSGRRSLAVAPSVNSVIGVMRGVCDGPHGMFVIDVTLMRRRMACKRVQPISVATAESAMHKNKDADLFYLHAFKNPPALPPIRRSQSS